MRRLQETRDRSESVAAEVVVAMTDDPHRWGRQLNLREEGFGIGVSQTMVALANSPPLLPWMVSCCCWWC
jgi:hypothetical protein